MVAPERTASQQEAFQILVNKGIDNQTFTRIKSNFPIIGKCPTCGDRGRYQLDFEVYECDCAYQKLLQKHYYAANIGREYHDICLEHFIGEDASLVTETLTNYLDNFEAHEHYGAGLTFTGGFGTGKTFAQAIVLKELIKRGRNVYMITFEELINTWGSAWNNDEAQWLFDKLRGAEVLAIDELRTDPRNAGGFLANGLDAVVRHRTSNLLPTLLSTNMEPHELEREFTKVYSLLSAKNSWVVTKGEDQRAGKVRRRTNELRERNERRPVC